MHPLKDGVLFQPEAEKAVFVKIDTSAAKIDSKAVVVIG
jgi:hypothetical protein